MNEQVTTSQPNETAYAWFRAMGAVRPMSAAADYVLVMGTWSEGHYPIEYREIRDQISRDENGRRRFPRPFDEWRLFGILCQPLDRDDVTRIMRHLEAVKK